MSKTLALDYGRRAERQRPEEPDVDPQVRFCERGRSRERSLLDPGVPAPPERTCSQNSAPPERGTTQNGTLKGCQTEAQDEHNRELTQESSPRAATNRGLNIAIDLVNPDLAPPRGALLGCNPFRGCESCEHVRSV